MCRLLQHAILYHYSYIQYDGLLPLKNCHVWWFSTSEVPAQIITRNFGKSTKAGSLRQIKVTTLQYFTEAAAINLSLVFTPITVLDIISTHTLLCVCTIDNMTLCSAGYEVQIRACLYLRLHNPCSWYVSYCIALARQVHLLVPIRPVLCMGFSSDDVI